MMKFAKTRASKPYLNDMHAFGCPAFVLAGPFNQEKTPRWKDRAITGIYLGSTPQHAGNVSLILNLRTGHVSPQFREPENWNFLCLMHFYSLN